jgi:hypothetical protein
VNSDLHQTKIRAVGQAGRPSSVVEEPVVHVALVKQCAIIRDMIGKSAWNAERRTWHESKAAYLVEESRLLMRAKNGAVA